MLFVMLAKEYPYQKPSMEDKSFHSLINGRLGDVLINAKLSFVHKHAFG